MLKYLHHSAKDIIFVRNLKANDMERKYRVFEGKSPDPQQKPYLIEVPTAEIEPFCDTTGFYKVNNSFDPSEPVDEWNLPYDEGDGSENGEDGVWFYDKELTQPVVFSGTSPDYEYERVYDGSNFREVVLTSTYFDCKYVECTDEYADGYFAGLEHVILIDTGTGEKGIMIDGNGRFWLREKSFWVNSYRATHTELSKAEAARIYADLWCKDDDYRELFGDCEK